MTITTTMATIITMAVAMAMPTTMTSTMATNKTIIKIIFMLFIKFQLLFYGTQNVESYYLYHSIFFIFRVLLNG